MKAKEMVLALMLLIPTVSFALIKSGNVANLDDYNHFSHVIPDYRKKLSAEPLIYSFTGETELPQVEVKRYKMTSQSWSPDKMVIPGLWQHDVDIYIPESPKSIRAVVVVNNGTNHDAIHLNISKPSDFSEETLSAIARATKTIIISVSNIPNQYLTYQLDSKPLKEDDSVARSWTLFMDDPQQRDLIPLHIPMAISVSQAMRVAKQELKAWNINKFIVTGVSKRGWTTWLTAISDPDVEAIIPIAIDLLATNSSLNHMYRSYGGNWPVAFYSYYQKGIDKLINTANFSKLMLIEDPFQYMNSIYQPRLAIPKYIINASGDDFYVPDNTRFYYDKLPGEKSLRIAPNTDHYGIKKFTEQSIISFVNRIQDKKALPKLKSIIHNKTLIVNFSEKPVKITRWTAKNSEARDFRYACGIKYIPSSLDKSAENKIEIPLSYTAPGWEAIFIEATFNDGYVATTQVHIIPDEKYPRVAPPAQEPACQSLPGRGLGGDNQ